MPTTTMTTTARAIRRLRIITGIDYILGHPARPRNEGGLHADLHRPRQLHRSGDPEHQGRPQAPRRRQEDAEGHGRRAEAVLSDDGRPRHRHGHGGPERRDGREVHSHALRGRQRPHDDDEGVHRGGVPEADLDASVTLPEYRVKARNTAESPENKIHDDAVARQYGFRGGLVPGVTVYAYLTHPLVAAFGAAGLDRGARGFVHPGFFLDQANRALDKNVTLSPWIHVGSVVRHLSGARVGETLATRGRVRSLFKKKGREFVELDLVIVAGERSRPVAHILHTPIYRLPAP